MIRYSANLGFLWRELDLPAAIRRAKDAGFAAVECHWPYDEDAGAVRAALIETGLPMLGLNTRKGAEEGDFGLAAVPGREAEARAAIEEAFAYADAIGAQAVHVMAGRAGDDQRGGAVFEANLRFACDLAAGSGRTVLIEPINGRDVPGYFLSSVEQAAAIVARLARPELKIMFDCYHTQITEGDLLTRFERHQAAIGHVQIAAVPSRAEPDEGEVAYPRLLAAFDAAGYDGFIGAEYRPRGRTEDGLRWMMDFAL
ncbi:hydroxypyruvate isomerase family protein [Mangrovicella endophytica]|uniref:hydroxypyruvate isomerase family protein n=1 Tax=Mangrovicella endophytica TaxID=2066697 RepID=UPI000C9E77BF|nr:TIM barrel protein [Mangrovicella endophytica]